MKDILYSLTYKFMRINPTCGNIAMDVLGLDRYTKVIDYMKKKGD